VLHDASGQRVATLATTHRETLLDCLLRHDRPIRTQCRGSLICGGSVVRDDVGLESLPAPNASEVELLERVAPGAPRARLACQITLPPGLDRLVVSTDYW
jgi:ferredoxin